MKNEVLTQKESSSFSYSWITSLKNAEIQLKKPCYHNNGNLYHYAGNNPVRYTDPNGMEDDIPTFEELNKQYDETLNKLIKLSDISDNFSDATSLITAGKNKIGDVLSSIVMSESDKIEKEMKQNYPDNYENIFHPMYKFSGGGVTASW